MNRHADTAFAVPSAATRTIAPAPTTRRLASGVRAISPFPTRPFDPDRLEALDRYADRFADLFARADQAKRFRVYLRGLLEGSDRKNVEAIASRSVADGVADSGLSQALQHFVSHSPWDAGFVTARYRAIVRETLSEAGGVWVVHDGVIPKKGRHSVGTQRQFARSVGRKLNCQVAVVVGWDGPAGYLPLAIRLYLPGYWLRENQPAVEKTVPDGFRSHVPKSDIALGVIDELVAEGWPAREVVADDAYTGHGAFRDGLESRSLRLLEPATDALTRSADVFDWIKAGLGLEHFEGRTWVGWHHHAAVVLTAFGFLVAESASRSRPTSPHTEHSI